MGSGSWPTRPSPTAATGVWPCRSTVRGTRWIGVSSGGDRATRSLPGGPSAAGRWSGCRGRATARDHRTEMRPRRCRRRRFPAHWPLPSQGEGSGAGWRGRGDGPKPRGRAGQFSSGCRVEAESAYRAISSAVEHLPYKEIVTGSIPVSPIL